MNTKDLTLSQTEIHKLLSAGSGGRSGSGQNAG